MVQEGSTGSAVADLQRRLHAAGFYQGALDGDFGPQTKAAVVAFQKSKGLAGGGVVGPTTWGLLASPLDGKPRLEQGAKGADVSELQRGLKAAGYDPGPIDADFGPKTKAAVVKFQQAQGLAGGGGVGPTTWNLLGLAGSAPEKPVDSFDGPANAPRWKFSAASFPGFYDASHEASSSYNFAQIIKDIPTIWNKPYSQDVSSTFKDSFAKLGGKPNETYGALFTRIGAEMGVDPCALAAYCVFESYNSNTHSFNPQMKDVSGSMYAAGMAATQAQDWKGCKIPGLDQRLPSNVEDAAWQLRASPEYAVRCLASEFKDAYGATGDLARAFPRVAYPSWKDPGKSMGAYGTQAEYVSRAWALYQAFSAEAR